MKSGKTIATAKRALEILNNLMHKKMSVNEILDSLDFDKDYELIYTKEAVYKYMNTFKASGFIINKDKGAYSIEKSFTKIDLSDEDKYILNFLENYINTIQNKEYKTEFNAIKSLLEKNNADLYTNISCLENEKLTNINKKYQPYSKLIEQIEQSCIKKENLIITYKNIDNEILKYSVVPDKIVFEKSFLVLYAFNKELYEYSKFLIENIVSVEYSPKIGIPNFYKKHLVFEVFGELAKNYRLKKNEYLQEQGKDYLIIVNKGQNHRELLKRLLRYSDKCKILYPSEFRTLAKEKIEKTLALYKD